MGRIERLLWLIALLLFAQSPWRSAVADDDARDARLGVVTAKRVDLVDGDGRVVTRLGWDASSRSVVVGGAACSIAARQFRLVRGEEVVGIFGLDQHHLPRLVLRTSHSEDSVAAELSCDELSIAGSSRSLGGLHFFAGHRPTEDGAAVEHPMLHIDGELIVGSNFRETDPGVTIDPIGQVTVRRKGREPQRLVK